MNNKLLSFDWQLLSPVLILITISFIVLFSLNPVFLKSQIVFFIVSIFAFLLFSNINIRLIRLYSLQIYLASIILLVLVFIIGIESRGSLRWIEVLGFRIQFSEILKPFLGVVFANFLASKKNLDFKDAFQTFILLAPIALLIFLQPDLGSTLIYTIVVFCTIIYAGFSLRNLSIIFLPILIITPLFWNFLHDYQRQRLLTFIDPSKDPLGSSYNVIQSVIAVGSGMLLGKGLGLGTQSGLRFLPERHTDFIFASMSEQLGFVGSGILLFCFALFLYRIYRLSLNSNEKFNKVFLSVVFFTFLIQGFINIGMNIGILPIVGITLPFVSYGGSSLLSNFIFLGLMISISKSYKKTDVLEIK